MTKIPHFRYPFEMRPLNRAAALIEQDSDQEIAQAAYGVLATRIGESIDEPELGISGQAFRKNGADLAEIRSALAKWEPRAAEGLTDAQLEGVIQMVRVSIVG